jgi:hypothetical protein
MGSIWRSAGPRQTVVAHALARTTLRVVTNVGELEPDVAQALACRGELQFAQRDFSPARSVT